jgi:hypothetical protein
MGNNGQQCCWLVDYAEGLRSYQQQCAALVYCNISKTMLSVRSGAEGSNRQ